MRVLLVDDDQLLCFALSKHLELEAPRLSATTIRATPTFTLEGAINTINSDDRPDLVFLDLGLDGDVRNASTLKRFQEKNAHQIPVVVFTGLTLTESGTAETLRACFGELGARGILLKGVDLDTAFIGLGRLLNGERWMPEAVFMALATTPPPPPSKYHLGLSPREWDVARGLTRGLQNKEIAYE